MLIARWLLHVMLLLIFFQISLKLLENYADTLEKEIHRRKLEAGPVISRKDIASIRSEITVKNKFLYRLVLDGLLLPGMIPYSMVFDDHRASEMQEYLGWCRKYLVHQGFTGFRITGSLSAECIGLLCEREGRQFYVECRLVNLSPDTAAKDEDNWPKVNRPDIQIFVGTMAINRISCGMIVTTGDFTKDAVEYASTLPEPYRVELVDGRMLTDQLEKLRAEYIV